MTGPVTPLIELSGVTVHRGGVRVLDVSSLAVAAGETLGLVGPNGSGKTSLLLTLATLLGTTAGTISFRGAPVATRRDRLAYRRRCAFVFQEPLLFSGSVADNVASGLRMRGMGRAEIARRVDETLHRLRIDHLRGRAAQKLSGGEAQRTSLARAFATAPDLIFLDEPFSSLDANARESLVADLAGTLRETGATAVIITHDAQEALALTDRIAVMERGRIVADGPADDMFNNPVSEFMASFAGMETVLVGRVASTRGGAAVVDVSGHAIETAVAAEHGSAVALCIRPENVSLSVGPARAGARSSVRNSFPARVVDVYRKGVFFKVRLDCGFPLVSHVTADSLERLRLAPGRQVAASFKATAVHVIRK